MSKLADAVIRQAAEFPTKVALIFEDRAGPMPICCAGAQPRRRMARAGHHAWQKIGLMLETTSSSR